MFDSTSDWKNGVDDSLFASLLPVERTLTTCYHLKFQTVYGLASLFYFLPSLGYVIFDICTFGVPSFDSVPSNAFTVAMGSLLMIDSLFFLAGFYMYDRALFVCWSVGLWGDILNVVASAFFIVSQGLYYLTANDFVTTTQIGWHWAVWYFVSYVFWAVSALLYFKGYFDYRAKGHFKKGTTLRQKEFWDEFLNTFASIGYIGTSLYGLIPLRTYITSAVTTDDPVEYFSDLQAENFEEQAKINVIFDFAWTVGGLVNIYMWWKDGTHHFNKQSININRS